MKAAVVVAGFVLLALSVPAEALGLSAWAVTGTMVVGIVLVFGEMGLEQAATARRVRALEAQLLARRLVETNEDGRRG